ncbi:phenylalanyl tRNA synthetase alpha chain B [Echinococcus multilocularis]|uniref:phenylalanine--tRNA ligase n=1 Tax=Echinococcus multilocularis TaxID=6211 RepID=A0A068YFX1_ECHMU|nr:phenylalanyl tRNA synthetase alpha chain B [Echinococcus multilocularis]
MDIAQIILDRLANVSPINSLELAQSLDVDHQVVVGGVKSLQQIDGLVKAKPIVQTKLALTDEGEYVLKHGSHEFVVYSAIPDEGIPMPELMKISKYAKLGVSKALASKWISVTKNDSNVQIVNKFNKPTGDDVQSCLEKLKDCSISERSDLKKRKLIVEKKVTVYSVERGPDFTTNRVKEETDLTSEMIATGSWQSLNFKKYNFKALGVPPEGGHLHPLLRVRSEFRRILMDMGFSEMPTNNYVESSFWNFDSLFQPQQHPARDAHDTFFLSDPATTDLLAHYSKDYVERVKRIHEKGGCGSKGYSYDWKLSEAAKNLLRTHTTAVSARMLYKLAQQKEFTPQRYFSIDRVFRNETLDATHLAEFHQVEGVFADYGLCLGHLKAVIRAFFSHLGLHQLRFKPTYNPYTEPSMEIFSFHPGLKKWVEIGNSGIFRPEMLRPMGLPEGVRVIAWGLSLERPTMIRYGYKNIRDLMGPKIDLRMVYDSPLCRLDKF